MFWKSVDTVARLLQFMVRYSTWSQFAIVLDPGLLQCRYISLALRRAMGLSTRTPPYAPTLLFDALVQRRKSYVSFIAACRRWIVQRIGERPERRQMGRPILNVYTQCKPTDFGNVVEGSLNRFFYLFSSLFFPVFSLGFFSFIFLHFLFSPFFLLFFKSTRRTSG